MKAIHRLSPQEARRTIDRVRRSGYVLLGSLLLMLIAIPFAQERLVGVVVETSLLTLMLCSAVSTVAGRNGLKLAVAFVTPTTVLAWAHQLHPSAWLRITTCALAAAFVGWVALRLVRSVLAAREVDGHVLCAALSSYLLIGLIWAMLYAVTAQALPASFSLSATEGTRQRLVPFELIYFSFITLCTVGYGDIVPGTNPARMLAMLEAVIGMIYTTVLLARLVSLYSTKAVQEQA